MEFWYALNTLPHAENTVALALAQRGISVYLPTIPIPKSYGQRATLQPLFPAYLFCRCDFSVIPFAVLRWIPGLRRLVAFGDMPAVVPDEAIRLIQQKTAEIARDGGLPKHPFQPGDTVQVKSGPFEGLLAIFEGPMHPSKRVYILLELLGRVNRVEVAPELLEPVRHPPRRTRGRGRWIRRYKAEIP